MVGSSSSLSDARGGCHARPGGTAFSNLDATPGSGSGEVERSGIATGSS